MNTFKFMCHAKKKNLWESLLVVFTRFAGVPRKSPILTRRNSRLRPGKLQDLMGHIENKQDNFQEHCLDI